MCVGSDAYSSGTVSDADNDETLIGASVTATGEGYRYCYRCQRSFHIESPRSSKTLTVSYVGYQTKQVAITDGNMVIRLESDNALSRPLVVVAFGQQKKSSFTGSAATVGSAEIEKSQVTNPSTLSAV